MDLKLDKAFDKFLFTIQRVEDRFLLKVSEYISSFPEHHKVLQYRDKEFKFNGDSDEWPALEILEYHNVRFELEEGTRQKRSIIERRIIEETLKDEEKSKERVETWLKSLDHAMQDPVEEDNIES